MRRAENDDPVRTPPQRPAISTRKKIAFAVLTVVTLLGGLELGARLVGRLLGQDARVDDGLRSAWAADGWAIDPVLGWTLIANDSRRQGGVLCVTNSLALRGPEIAPEKAPGSLRVLAVGDSTVMAYGVEQDLGFTQVLQQQLSSRLDRPVEVVNAGVPGYSSEQVKLYLRARGLALGPDVVVFLSNFNDRRAVVPGAEPDSAQAFRRVSRRVSLYELANHSALARLLRRLLFRHELAFLSSGDFAFNEIPVDAPPRVPLERYEKNLRAIVRDVRASGASIVFVGLPDNPSLVGGIDRAEEFLRDGKLWAAERELMGALFRPMQKLLAQRTLNRILERAGRTDEIRRTVPAGLPEKSTGGYTPVLSSSPYVEVIRRLGGELGVPVVVMDAPPGVEPEDLYLYRDQTHLNARGHALLARRLEGPVSRLLGD